MKTAFFAVFAFVLIAVMSSVASGQDKTVQPRPDSKDMHGLIIYGHGFVFLASEPEGWDADTGQRAKQYGVNAIFFPRAETSHARHVNIRVRLNRKTTENPSEDMAVDVSEYKRQYPSTQFAALDVRHPDYKMSAKVFFTPNQFYEYVAYLNPGQQYRFIFSVALSKEKEPATTEELVAFKHVLQSLYFVTEDVQHVP